MCARMCVRPHVCARVCVCARVHGEGGAAWCLSVCVTARAEHSPYGPKAKGFDLSLCSNHSHTIVHIHQPLLVINCSRAPLINFSATAHQLLRIINYSLVLLSNLGSCSLVHLVLGSRLAASPLGSCLSCLSTHGPRSTISTLVYP